MESKKVETKKETKEIKKASAKGFSLGCLFGLHAWGADGYCIYCGKKR